MRKTVKRGRELYCKLISTKDADSVARRFIDMFFSNKFIKATGEYCTYEKNIPAPLLRRKFIVNDVKNVVLSICGLGFYRLFVNGKEITAGRLCTSIYNPDHFLFYDEYVLDEYIEEGENVICVMLGNGFLNNVGGNIWDMDKATFRDAPKVALSLSQGGKVLFEADERFLCAPSPVLFDDYRSGEIFDAREIKDGWNEVGYDDSGWKPSFFAIAPNGRPQKYDGVRLKAHKELKPLKITPCGDRYAVINNTDKEQTTIFYDMNGKAQTLRLNAYEIKWL